MTQGVQLLGLRRDQAVQIGERSGISASVAAKAHRLAHRGGRLEEEVRSTFALGMPSIHDRIRGDDATSFRGETEKLVLEFSDGARVETVRIHRGRERESQCLSTQVGCGMACQFCETGRMGLLRQLEPSEIVGQVVSARSLEAWKPQNLVFQGMGEPLDNVESLIQAMEVLCDSNGLGFGRDKLTVCTAGHVEGLERLHELGWRRLNLSLSLNACDDELRDRLMPINRRWPLRELQATLVRTRQRANAQLGIHYCLMPGLNDGRAAATALAEFCRPLGRVLIHLIPYNPGSKPLTRAPEDDEIDRFVGWLRDEGLPVRRRITKGRASMAACGQLGDIEHQREMFRERRTP